MDGTRVSLEAFYPAEARLARAESVKFAGENERRGARREPYSIAH